MMTGTDMRYIRDVVIELRIGDVTIRVTRKEAERLLARLKKQMEEQENDRDAGRK